MSPAHHSGERRWRVVALVVLALAGVAAVASRGTTPAAVPEPSALVSAPDAESSAWYCTGQTAGPGVGPGAVVLTNTTTSATSASVSVVSDTRSAAEVSVAIPARAAVVPPLPAPSSGTWVSQTVRVAGGGVAVTQAVHGSSGWSVAPCQSTTSASWFFPSGTTSNSDALFVSLLNPTSTPVVVDLSFVTPTGTVHPINYQGVVLEPGQLQVENVAAEVQNQSTVSTVVTARTGRLVAAELQQFAGSSGGLSIVPGVARPVSHWSIPASQELAGGTSQLDVFNPGTVTEEVTVHMRLPSGPLAPLTDRVAPGTTWVLATSAQTRIPDGAPYSTHVVATGGSGVVVGRLVVAPASAPARQAGVANAIDGLSAASPTGLWVVPPPGTAASPAVSGATPMGLSVFNAAHGASHYVVVVVTPSGARTVGSGTVGAQSTATLGPTVLAFVGFDPLIVRSSGPVAVSEDLDPSGNTGVVTMPGLPLAAAIGR